MNPVFWELTGEEKIGLENDITSHEKFEGLGFYLLWYSLLYQDRKDRNSVSSIS